MTRLMWRRDLKVDRAIFRLEIDYQDLERINHSLVTISDIFEDRDVLEQLEVLADIVGQIKDKKGSD